MGAQNSTNVKVRESLTDSPVSEEREKDEYAHLGTVSIKLSW